MVIVGMLLVLGGAVGIWVNIRNNLPSPFDIADASGQNDNFLPIIAPASSGSGSKEGSATLAAAPTVITDESNPLVIPPQHQSVGLIPDRLVIPSIDLDAPVISVSYKEIKVGDQVYYQWLAPDQFAVGWQDPSTLLGLPGNTVLNGHHNAFGKVFKDLVRLDIGDVIIIYSGSQEFRYQVVAKMLLPERFVPLSTRMENARWIAPSTDERITLITCWPADSNTHRVVVVAFPIDNPNISSAPDQTAQSPAITICYDNTTMTINVSDLSQYPDYREGACTSQTPELTIKKSVTETSYTLVGDRLHYSYLVTNTGNVSLIGVGVADDKTTVSCPKTNLDLAEFMTCTATYTVKNADMSVENITNKAYATGLFGDVPVQSDPDSQTVVRFFKLILSAICAADPNAQNGWQVVNNNPYPVNFEYAIDGGVSGVSTVPANSMAIFETPVGSGTGVMGLYEGGLLQNNASAATGCQ
jgi:sortase A